VSSSEGKATRKKNKGIKKRYRLKIKRKNRKRRPNRADRRIWCKRIIKESKEEREEKRDFRKNKKEKTDVQAPTNFKSMRTSFMFLRNIRESKESGK
jgi:hypothetical protein